MAPRNTIFLEDNDPDFDYQKDLIDNSEYGTYFNIQHFLLGLGVCL